MGSVSVTEHSTTDGDEIVSLLDEMYGLGNSIVDVTPSLFRTRSVGDERSNLAEIDVGGAIRMKCAPVDGVFFVHVSDGVYRARMGGRARDFHRGDFFALPPGREWTASTEDMSEHVMFLSLDELAATAWDATGSVLRRGVFSQLSAADPTRVAPVAGLWKQLATVLTRADLQAHTLLRTNIHRNLVVSVLQMFEALEPAHTDRGAERVLRLAFETMRARIGEPLTVADIARTTGYSVRSVQSAFAQHLQTTPMAYLRQLRLEAAHAELLQADPAVQNVSVIARRWGFAQMGRFAGEYFAKFGEHPRETLRR